MKNKISTLLSGGLLALTLLSSCENQKVILNREVNSRTDGQMLLGDQTLSQFQREPYALWYDTEYQNYTPDAEKLKELKKKKLQRYDFIVYLGTWCSDSHREFPRFIKILTAYGYPLDKVKIIGLNRKKESPGGEEGLYNIQRVPTIIVKKYGKEIGRITEAPTSGSLEEDILRITEKDNTRLGDLFQK